MKKNIDIRNFALGTGGVSKTDEFSEKFQKALDPPPSFSKNHVAIFSKGLLISTVERSNI